MFIGISTIPGVMLGFELVYGEKAVVVDLLIVRLYISYGDEPNGI